MRACATPRCSSAAVMKREGAPAFWPWVQIIRSYVHEREPEWLASLMGSGAADIAPVVLNLKSGCRTCPHPFL